MAETGSRGGMDIAAMAQPTDGAKPGMPLYSDNSSSSFDDNLSASDAQNDELEASCNTQMFNFNLNAMQVSTPYNKRTVAAAHASEEDLGSSRKQLFMEPNALSTILEETRSAYG